MTISKDDQARLYRYYTEPTLVTELTRKTLALVLAGGEGSRLKDLTAWRAKPAVPIGGKYRIIDFPLSNCVNSGIRRIGVLTQYKSHSLIRHLQRAWGLMRTEVGEFVEILPAQQRTHKKEWYQGTADALFQNLDIMQRHHPEYVLVLGGDHVYTMDYTQMLLYHVQTGADVTVGSVEVPVAEAAAFGVMSVDESLRITEFNEKPREPDSMPGKPGTALVSMGIYVFSKDFLYKALIEDAGATRSSHDFGKDIIPSSISRARIMAFPFRDREGKPGYWRDVGALNCYWQTNMDLCSIEPALNLYDCEWPIWTYQPQYPPAKFIFDDEGRRGEAIDSLVAGGCVLSGARVKRSVLFFATTVGCSSLVKDSVILPKVRIGRNCRISCAIIDKGTVIPDGTVIGEDPVEDAKRFHVTPEGIVLVTPRMLGQNIYARWEDEYDG
ncbi:glucose-1-phosphate adenylyltransferase [Thiobacillus denitrificans ATCC 25259]|uniref:Glucose-1-phosphate adenylyltransferase n=1 Tax=Thiobacillus denitrificans (strain ATCC 25259 / T1) TaxID=292415 RepID=GLGC_THIDA|nr:glucose-1-phosphate adenylyltransferase [Thiobacillus denitrificans]Q3SH75.1 RecName: Full=Glucose-1-phosphate adenylyltransferase; AltName: Full=ADP-glucose pyrophosphorylase; Short=ADPGlc PPase; AltName: Full=ADP-glucose synthase [Thiobacillus denitrificans ATCC 25259]AAZ98014.1 glucose-1-phosphate adenylyltransferase [Thiobacillus denitrificans ATCC 25259]